MYGVSISGLHLDLTDSEHPTPVVTSPRMMFISFTYNLTFFYFFKFFRGHYIRGDVYRDTDCVSSVNCLLLTQTLISSLTYVEPGWWKRGGTRVGNRRVLVTCGIGRPQTPDLSTVTKCEKREDVKIGY